jgi:PhoH-like ATPase
MRKTFFVDTSVFIYDPNCLNSKKFAGNDIILPIQILEELDKLKKGLGEVPRNARMSIRNLDQFKDLHIGQKLENKSFIKIETESFTKIGEDSKYNDNMILGCAVASKKKNKVVISRDINLRVRAKALGLEAEDYIEEKKTTEEFYSGMVEIINEDWIQEISEKGYIELIDNEEILPNQCVVLKDKEGHEAALGKRVDNKIKLIKKHEAWGIIGRNTEQVCAMDLILDPTIPLVSLMGSAGTGKSIIALAAALELVLNRRKYNKLIIYRPVQVVGNQNLGFLPGSFEDKVFPLMSAVFDNLEVLFAGNKPSKKINKNWFADVEMLVEKDLIEFSTLTFLRGRSISNTLIIMDECENFTVADIKTMVSRLNHGSKIILLGDVEQIDSKELDADNNGLSVTVEAFRDSKLAGHITLAKSQRSDIAAEAVKRL